MSRKTAFAMAVLPFVFAAGSAAAQDDKDAAETLLAQCWKGTVTIETLMQVGAQDPELNAEQTQSLYKAVEARDAGDYDSCVKELENLPGNDK